MLVLMRKKNESIIIDDRIKVMVVEIRGDKVRLGIEADPSIPVHREEVWLAIQAETPAPAEASCAISCGLSPEQIDSMPIAGDEAA